MALDRAFAASYIDNGNTHRVLGVKLHPFCAWHLFLLQAVDSPFLQAGQVYLFHIRRAVGICRLRYPQSRVRPPWTWNVNQKKLHREVAKFLRYIGDYINKPEYTIVPVNEFAAQRGHRKVTPAPDVVQLVFDAAHGANCTVNQAWDMPIGQAYVAQAMHLRQTMMVDFMDEKEREFQAAMLDAINQKKNGEDE